VTIAVAKKKGSNAVWVADAVLQQAEELERKIVPSDIEMIVTRNYGLSANDKVNGLLEGLAVAILIVVALLTSGLGWREALIVAVAVPVVFGLTLAANLLLGYTINRVTLFALILSLGLLVDDPIVDVENIARHFALARGQRVDRPEAVRFARHSPRDVGRHLQFSADVLHHGDDRTLHASHGAQRPGHDAHVDGRGIHDHSLAGLSRTASQVPRRSVGRSFPPQSRRSGRREAIGALQVFLPLDGSFAWVSLRGLVVSG
jgi:hypothetical protein